MCGLSDYEEMAVRSPFQIPESTLVCVYVCVSGDHAHAAISHLRSAVSAAPEMSERCSLD